MYAMQYLNEKDIYFNIKLVQEVKKHPMLYNSEVKGYCNFDITETVWRKIAEKLNEAPTYCKEKWRNLRTVFNKKMKQSQTRNPRARKYYLYEHIKFIKPFIQHKTAKCNHKPDEQTDSNGETSPTEDTQETVTKMKMEIEEPAEDEITEEVMIPECTLEETILHQDTEPKLQNIEDIKNNCHTESDPLVEKKLRPKIYCLNNKNKKWSEMKLSSNNEKLRKRNQFDYEDPRRQFMLSLLPDIRQMSDMQMRKFKRSVLELVDNILEE